MTKLFKSSFFKLHGELVNLVIPANSAEEANANALAHHALQREGWQKPQTKGGYWQVVNEGQLCSWEALQFILECNWLSWTDAGAMSMSVAETGWSHFNGVEVYLRQAGEVATLGFRDGKWHPLVVVLSGI